MESQTQARGVLLLVSQNKDTIALVNLQFVLLYVETLSELLLNNVTMAILYLATDVHLA